MATKEDQQRQAAEEAARQRAAEEEQQRQAADRARREAEAKDQALARQVRGADPGADADPLPLIARALDRLAPPDPARAPVEPQPGAETRPGGLFRVGNRLVNAQGQEIRDATPGAGGKLYGGSLYDPREGRVVREFGADEPNEG